MWFPTFLRIRLSQPPAGDWLAGAWAELGNNKRLGLSLAIEVFLIYMFSIKSYIEAFSDLLELLFRYCAFIQIETYEAQLVDQFYLNLSKISQRCLMVQM